MEQSSFAPALRGLAQRLAQTLGLPELAAATLALVRERAADERLALAFMLKLAEQSHAQLIEVLGDPLRASELVLCLGASEVVAGGLCAMEPAAWPGFFERARTQAAAALLESIRCEAVDTAGRHQAARSLAAFKQRIFLQIAMGDLLGRLSVTETTAAMSRLAEECAGAALDAALKLLGPAARMAGDFCVLAMGKLGAGELNLSSDIDLIYLFAGPDDPARQEAARRVGELVTEILSAGCFRTDLRLRPGGRNSPLVVSIESALGFYENFGQTWERAALLRIRPIAGAIEVGRRFIAALGRFIYRRYLDFDTLRQLRAMKHRIEVELRSPSLLERNIKLGYGGIRELEFIVQALTLIYGGRDPRLRTAATLEAFDRLEAYGYMPAARVDQLKAAYLFLRNVEHKLQVAAGLQTHTLPGDADALAAVAARLGMGKDSDAVARMAAALKTHRDFVATQFREMLAGGDDRGNPVVSPAALAAWRAAPAPQRSAPLLGELGFARADETSRHLALLAQGPSHAPASPRRRELLERLGPLILDEVRGLADPDLALMNLASFIAAVGARTSFLALLEEHPATRAVLLRLFASSSHLSALFIRHPDMLDTLVRSDLARLRRSAGELAHELSELVAACEDFETRLDAIRAFRHQEFLRIAIADLAGDLELDEVRAELTRLAETVLREAFALACAEVNALHPVPAQLKLCAIAMGRLGAAEMAYNSDLDLIFVYHEPDGGDGGGRVIASRIVQKLIAILEARTREGYAYKLDLRLRPSGNTGPLVAALDGFRAYHRLSSVVWERQALVRARVIAGDEWLGAEVEAARQEFVFGRGLNPAEVREIAAMRLRMELEIGAENRYRLNLKQGRGGLVDVEFITQMMALAHGHRIPALRRRRTVELIHALRQSALIAAAGADDLEADYRFLVRLENRLRIESDQPAWALATAPGKLLALARRMGYAGADAPAQLLGELARRRNRIRAAFDACFAREQGA